jgi:hypothetical protein
MGKLNPRCCKLVQFKGNFSDAALIDEGDLVPFQLEARIDSLIGPTSNPDWQEVVADILQNFNLVFVI